MSTYKWTIVLSTAYTAAMVGFIYSTGMYVAIFTSEDQRTAALNMLDNTKISHIFTSPEDALRNIEKYREWTATLGWLDSMPYDHWLDYYEDSAHQRMRADEAMASLPPVPELTEEPQP